MLRNSHKIQALSDCQFFAGRGGANRRNLRATRTRLEQSTFFCLDDSPSNNKTSELLTEHDVRKRWVYSRLRFSKNNKELKDASRALLLAFRLASNPLPCLFLSHDVNLWCQTGS